MGIVGNARTVRGYAWMTLLLAGTVLMAGAAWAKKAESTVTLPGGADLSGQVVDTDGKPVKKAEVFLYYSYGEDGVYDRFLGMVKANGKGKFTFKQAVVWEPLKKSSGREKPKYVVLARHKKLGISSVNVTKDDPIDKVTVKMFSLIERKIMVKDSNGKPVEGAKVFLCSAEMMKEGTKEPDRDHRYMRLNQDIGISSGVTDAEGRVDVMAPHEASFKVLKDTYAEGFFDGKSTVLMFPGARVSGKVTDVEGKPAAKVAVVYTYRGNQLAWSNAMLTDDQGHYAFDNVPSAGFRYSWMKPEQEEGPEGTGQIKVIDLPEDSPYVSKSESFPIKPGEDVKRDMALTKGVVFAGKVIDLTTNGPAKFMKLRSFIETGGQYSDSKEIKTDENGAFRVIFAAGSQVNMQWESSNEDGDYILDEEWRNQDNWQAFQGTVTEDVLDKEIKVKLWAIQPLQGTVVGADSKPVADAKVYIHADVDPVKTDAAGKFTLKTAPTDRDFQLLACTASNDQAGLVSLKAGSKEATITLDPTQSYKGQVLNPEGLPAADLSFFWQPKINNRGLFRIQETIKTDKNGEFTAKNVCPKAAYEVFWSSDNDQNRDYDYGNTTVDVAKLEPGKPIQFEAKQYLNALMGRVVNQKGEPVQDALIEVAAGEVARQNDQRNVKTDKNGEFEVPRLAAGDAALRVVADGYATTRVTAPSNSIDLEVKLKPAGETTRITVKVLDQDGKPLPNAPVALTKTITSGGEKPKTETQKAQTDGNGVGIFQLKPAPQEELQRSRGFVGCDVKGYTLAYRGVRLDEEAEVTLRVRKGGACWTGVVLAEDDKPLADVKVHVAGFRQSTDSNDNDAFAFLGDDTAPACTTDAEGRYELSRFSKEDALSINFKAPGYCDENTWFAEKGKTVRLVRGGDVEGKVVLKGTGELIPGMMVFISSQRNGTKIGSKDGTFKSGGLRPGEYTANCDAQDDKSRKYLCVTPVSFTITTGKTASIVVEVVEGIPVRGTFIEKNTGKPPKGNKEVAARIKDKPGQVVEAKVENDGSWVMYLPEGSYDLLYAVEALPQGKTFKTLTIEKGKTYEGLAIEVDLLQEESTEKK